MNDYRINFQLPASPLGPAIDEPLYEGDEEEDRAWELSQFERKNRPAFFATDPREWKSGHPPEPGWYIVGSLKDRYSATIRCHFDGQAWGEWVGLVDPSVRGMATVDKWNQQQAKWFRRCLPQDIGGDAPPKETRPEPIDTTPTSTGWIEHDGEFCPVVPTTLVRVKFGDGSVYATVEQAGAWSAFNWNAKRKHNYSIVAYRLAP